MLASYASKHLATELRVIALGQSLRRLSDAQLRSSSVRAAAYQEAGLAFDPLGEAGLDEEALYRADLFRTRVADPAPASPHPQPVEIAA